MTALAIAPINLLDLIDLKKCFALICLIRHGSGEYSRDEDGGGFREVHVNTIEEFWSLLRSWLRP